MNMEKLLSKDFVLFFIFSLFTVSIYQHNFVETPPPIYDALRYIEYAVNMEEHGTFGLHKDDAGYIKPGNENTPLYPLLLASTIRFDNNLKESLLCLLKTKGKIACQLQLNSIINLQCFLIVLTLCCLWLTSIILTSSRTVAWMSASFALLSGELFYFANRLLTESLIIPLFSAFILVLCLAFKTKQLRWHGLAALLLGLLTLTRPEYHYLFLAMFASQTLFCLIKKNNFFWKSLLLIFISYFTIVGSWQVRNYHHFENSSITSKYGAFILAYRVAYNQMSWSEWGVSFIYWFPDCGDSISKKLFPKEYYEKLNFDEGSYFLTGSKKILKKIKEETNHPDEELTYLLKNEVIGNLFKHSMVTLPLAWRGVFISKYWGVLGLLCFTILVFRFRDPANQKLIFLSLPAWFLVFLHAFISVNMPRYNLVLIPFYSISIAIILCSVIRLFSNKFTNFKNN